MARDIARLTLKPLEKKPLALPGRGDCDWWPQALIDAETLASGYGASVLRLLLFDPVRVYERRAPDGRRALSVLAAVETEQARLVLHAVLDVPVRSGRPVGYGAFLLGSVNLDDADVVRRFLATLAEELRPESMYHDPDGVSSSALFVGELSQQEEVGLRCDLWARGIHLKPYLGEPVRRLTTTGDAISSFSGDLALFAAARCGRTVGTIRGRLNAAAQRTKVVELAENEGPQLRVEWGLEVDDIALDAASIVGIKSR